MTTADGKRSHCELICLSTIPAVAFLVAHLVVGTTLRWGFRLDQNPFCLGVLGAGAGLLGIWLVAGPGRLAPRVLMLATTLQFGWWLLVLAAGWLPERERNDIIEFENVWLVIIATMDCVIVVVAASELLAFRYFSRWKSRAVGHNASFSQSATLQVSVFDLILWTAAAAACLVIRRDVLEGLRLITTSFDSTIEAKICWTVRCLALLAGSLAALSSVSVWRPKPEIALAIFFAAALTIMLIPLEWWLANFAQDADRLADSTRMLGYAAVGCELTLLLVLLPLHRLGARI